MVFEAPEVLVEDLHHKFLLVHIHQDTAFRELLQGQTHVYTPVHLCLHTYINYHTYTSLSLSLCVYVYIHS